MGNRLKKLALLGLTGLMIGTSVPNYVMPIHTKVEAATVKKTVTKKKIPVTFIRSTKLLHIGGKFMFEAQVGDTYGEVIWSVSDKNIATIGSKTGILIAKKAGNVKVTAKAKDSGTTKSVTVTITGNEITVKSNTYSKDYKNKKGKLLFGMSYKYPTLSGNLAGISKINESMIADKDKWVKAVKAEEVILAKEEAASNKYFIQHGDEVDYNITYNANNIVNIMYTGYYYTGGAHGMPYRSQTIYSLETGEKLGLSQIMKGSEKEIKDKVVKEFLALMKREPNMMMPDAIQIVKDTKLSDMKYYLTPDGICFYYDPYVLAAYAAGFVEVTIPFSETDYFNPIVLPVQ